MSRSLQSSQVKGEKCSRIWLDLKRTTLQSLEIKEEVRLIASDINIRLCGPRYLILLFDTLRSNLAQINIAENVGKKNNNYLNHSKNEKSLKKAFH